jgi:uncharacterized membrane protein YphA (DoxX/SURF4 family)
MNYWTRVFLVLLRLAIGWHFLVEGLEKVSSYSPTPAAARKPWTSEAYLREASGPLGPAFHWMAGDPLLDRLTPLPEDTAKTQMAHERFPPGLEKDWRAYFDRFVEHYQLEPAQRERADMVLTQRKEEYVLWLEGKRGTVKVRKKATPGSDSVEEDVKLPELVAEYRDKLQRVRDIEKAELLPVGAAAQDKLRKAKGELNEARDVLAAALDKQNTDMKAALESVFDHKTAEVWREKGPVPEPVVRHVKDWDRIDWIDFTTRWGLLVVGICLLAGLLTRSFCVAGAAFLLLFFLAMPPFPGLLESPRAEGHYLFLNKITIEMLALLALATTQSGRWFGLDGLLQFLNPRRWRSAPPVSCAARPAVAAGKDRSSPLSVKEPSHGY